MLQFARRAGFPWSSKWKQMVLKEIKFTALLKKAFYCFALPVSRERQEVKECSEAGGKEEQTHGSAGGWIWALENPGCSELMLRMLHALKCWLGMQTQQRLRVYLWGKTANSWDLLMNLLPWHGLEGLDKEESNGGTGYPWKAAGMEGKFGDFMFQARRSLWDPAGSVCAVSKGAGKIPWDRGR